MFLKYVVAGYPLLWIETFEEYRAILTYALKMEKAKEPYNLFGWDRVDGLKMVKILEDPDTKSKKLGFGPVKPTNEEIDLKDPMAILEWMEGTADNTILFLKDYHNYIEKDFIIRKIRNVIPMFKARGKVLAILSPCLKIPTEIKKDITVLSFTLPDRGELKKVLKIVCESGKPEIEYPKDDSILIDSALGMTSYEAENAFSISVIGKGSFDIDVVQREKAAIVKKTGLLEVIESNYTLDDIGGLENTKEWLIETQKCFSDEAKKFGIIPPRGALLAGPPGTGKTLTAKAISAAFKRPLLKMDLGKVFGQYVGQSEENIRTALSVAEAVAPCVLMIDEFDKAIGGAGNNGTHETTERVQATLLTWMNDHKADVFVVATANRVANIRSETIRGGRIDRIFWVDFPGFIQRMEILKIHAKKIGRKLDVSKLAKACVNFTGAEIEVWLREGLRRAFTLGKDLDENILTEVLPRITPIYKVMGDELKSYREWAKSHGAQSASREEATEEMKAFPDKRKISREE